MKPDPGVDWIRAVRRLISDEANNDLREFMRLHRALRGKYQRERRHPDSSDGAPCRPETVAGAPHR